MPTIQVPYTGSILCDGDSPVDAGGNVNLFLDTTKFVGATSPIVGRVVLIACPTDDDPEDATKVYHFWVEDADLPVGVTTLHPSDIVAFECVSCCESIQEELDDEKAKISAAEAAITALQAIAGQFSRATPGSYTEAGNQITIPIEDQDANPTGDTIVLNLDDTDTTYSVVANVLIASSGPTFAIVTVSTDSNNLLSEGGDKGAYLGPVIADNLTFSGTTQHDSLASFSAGMSITAGTSSFGGNADFSANLVHTGANAGFFGAAAVTQAAHVADPTGGGTIDAEARTAINAILVILENLGFKATS